MSLVNQEKKSKVKKGLIVITQEERVHRFEISALMKSLESSHSAEARKQADKEIEDLIK